MRHRLAILLGAIGVALAAPGLAQIRFYRIPGLDPGGIAVGPDGNVWFAAGDRVGRLVPADASVSYVPLTFTRADDIVAGPDGNLWYAGGSAGRITPDGALTEISVGGIGEIRSLTAGPDALWLGDFLNKVIWRLDLSGAVSPFAVAPSEPLRVTFGADGQIWFANISFPWLRSMTTSGAVTSYQLLNESVEALTAGPDGNVWFSRSHSVGFVTPTGAITTFPVAEPKNNVAIATGADGNLWVVGDDSFVCIPEGCHLPPENDGLLRVTPAGAQTFFSLPGGSVTSTGSRIAAGPDGSLWVSARDAIVRFDIAGAAQLQAIPTLDGGPMAALIIGLAAVGWIALRRAA
jgi:virginiamycin B lyase